MLALSVRARLTEKAQLCLYLRMIEGRRSLGRTTVAFAGASLSGDIWSSGSKRDLKQVRSASLIAFTFASWCTLVTVYLRSSASQGCRICRLPSTLSPPACQAKRPIHSCQLLATASMWVSACTILIGPHVVLVMFPMILLMQELPVNSRVPCAPLQAAEAPCELLSLTWQAGKVATAAEARDWKFKPVQLAQHFLSCRCCRDGDWPGPG